jgi:hypothetical protein
MDAGRLLDLTQNGKNSAWLSGEFSRKGAKTQRKQKYSEL